MRCRKKQATITGAASTIVSNNLTVKRALISDGNGKVGASSVTSTELGYLSGVTSAIQTQINALSTPAVVSVTYKLSGGILQVHKLGKLVQVHFLNGNVTNLTAETSLVIATGLPAPKVGMQRFNGRLFYGTTNVLSQFHITNAGQLEVVPPVTGEYGMSLTAMYISA